MVFKSRRRSVAAKSRRRNMRRRKFRAFKRSVNANRNLPIVSVGLGLPKKMLVTHKYVVVTTLTAALGTMANVRWSANGLFAPNESGGHQPMYFDQIKALYDHYTVIGSKAKLTFVPYGTGGPLSISTFINDDTTTTGTDTETIAENSLSKTRLVSTSLAVPIHEEFKWSAKKFFGKNVLENFDLRGDSTANPTEQSWYNLTLQSVDRASTANISYRMEIDYITVWTELKDLAAS